MKDTLETPITPALLTELLQLLEGAEDCFGQERVFRRALALSLAEFFTLGRHTVTQLLRTLGAVEHDWGAAYRLFSRGRFKEAVVAQYLFRQTLEHVPETEPYILTGDAVHIYRTGTEVAGSSWVRALNTAPFKRGLQRGQRFVEIAWLTPNEASYRRAVPLRWIPAVTEKAVPSDATPCKEWEAGLQGVQWVREALDAAGRSTQPLVAVFDGSYDTQGIWREVPEYTTFVIRCAKNRALYYLPEPPATPGRGAPRKYGERAPLPREWTHKRKQLQGLDLEIRGQMRHLQYRVVGPVLVEGAPDRPLFLIVVAGQTWGSKKRRHYRKPAYLLVNARRQGDAWVLPYPVKKLLEWAWQRWECEVGHREMKSTLQIGTKQCWGPHSAFAAVQWGVWLYGLSVLAAYRAWGLTQGPRRQGQWYRQARRWSFASLWNELRAELWAVGEFSPLCMPTLDKWLKKELWLTGLGNALADPAPI